MAVYLDLVMGLNFLVDWLLVLGTNRLAGFRGPVWRGIWAGGLGSFYSGVCLIRGMRFLAGPFWRMVCLLLICLLAFGWNPKRWGIYLLLSVALGGMAVSIGKPGYSGLLIAAGGIGVLCLLGFGTGIGGRVYVPLRIRFGGREVALTALRDTGNCLRDPITSEKVTVIGSGAARKLTGLTAQQLGDPIETLRQGCLPGLRLIPYRSVGNPNGMLLAMRFSDAWVGNRKENVLIAFAPEEIGRGEGYQALLGGGS